MAEPENNARYAWEQWEQNLAEGPEGWYPVRKWYWIAAAILSWAAFWRVADHFAESPYAQVLAWLIIGVAIWITTNY